MPEIATTPDIEKRWHEYAFQSIPPHYIGVMLRDMRRAFMAGVGCGLNAYEEVRKADLPSIEEGRLLRSLSEQMDGITAEILAGNDRA